MNDVEKLYQNFISDYPGNYTVYSALNAQAKILHQAHQAGNPAVGIQISNWFPDLVGVGTQEILESDFNEGDARLTIAHEYGFSNWDQVVSLENESLNRDFELAVNAVVNGDIEELGKLLSMNPELIRQRSQYGHNASLLIYIAANGVETWRQKTPANIVEVTKLLLDFGADLRDKASVYGDELDVKALLISSAHPVKLGKTDKLLSLLES